MIAAIHIAQKIVAAIGKPTVDLWQRASYLIALSLAVFWQSLRPINWRRTVREELVRQLFYTAVKAMRFIGFMALIIGVALVSQIIFWTNMAGQSEYVGKLIVMLFIRELAPVIVGMIIIGRSGMAIVAELGLMRVSGQTRMLDAMGLDPMIYIMLPRCVAMALSLFCLTIWFIFITLISGHLIAHLLGLANLNLVDFLNLILAEMSISDYIDVIVKSLLSGFLIAIICCKQGLSVQQSATEVPRALPTSFIHSTVALFVISVGTSFFI